MLLIRRILFALLISVAAGILIFILTYLLAVTISPPVFIDANGEERRVMPLGQAMLATALAVASGLVILVIVYRKYVKIMEGLKRLFG